MLAYAIAAAMMLQSQPRPAERPEPPQRERFGAWDVRITVDPVTDDVSIGAYLGTPTDNLTIACAKDAPDSTLVLWRSTTRFRETPYMPQNGDEVRFYRWPSGSVTYRFDQDAPVIANSIGRQDTGFSFAQAGIGGITGRIATASRLVLRDRVNEAHTVVFNLVPADTLRALERLNEVCGTTLGTLLPEAVEQAPAPDLKSSLAAGSTERP